MENFLVVGLGNPGIRFDLTRHNVGFMFLDSLNLGSFKKNDNYSYVTKENVSYIKPLTYMNLSGEAVLDFIGYYKIPVNNILVIFDDVSLPLGKVRIRPKGSCGGHNGIRNIIDIIKTENVKRIKVGVGGKPPEWDLDDWVLSKFNIEELEVLKESFVNVKEAVKLIVSGDIKTAMNKFN